MKDQRNRTIMIISLLGIGLLFSILAAIMNDGERPIVFVVGMGMVSLILFLVAGLLNSINEKERNQEWDDTLEKIREWDRRIE